jgi:muramoyltetrapeptide carboxypeptidase
MIETPPYLEAGDTIGLVCPAGYMSLDKVQACVRTLENWGYKTRIGKTVGGDSTSYFSATDKDRLDDLQQMIDEREIKAVLCARGGYGTGRLIDHIKFKKFCKKPKWIIGYSDITVLHCHLYSNYNIASLHSPMAGAFNDAAGDDPYLLSLKDALEGKKADYSCEAHEFNRQGKAKGQLVGGNLALLAHLTGTCSDIKTRGRILFIEDVGEYLYNIDRMLYQLKRSGKLDRLAGLVVGGFTDIKDTERPFGATAYEIIRDMVKEFDYPVCFDFPVSHTNRNYALKVGVEYSLKVSDDGARLWE